MAQNDTAVGVPAVASNGSHVGAAKAPREMVVPCRSDRKFWVVGRDRVEL